MAPNPPSQPKISWFPLVLFAVFLYCLFLSRPELRASDESVFAAVAQDMLANGNWLNPHFQGQPIRCFPLYPWAVALCSFFFFPPPAWGAPLSPAAIRLPALLALLGLAAIAAVAAKRYRDREAGITAASIVVSSAAALHVGLIAQNESFHALLLTAGWFVWYELGPQRQRWAAAWGCSLLLVFTDMLNIGLAAPLQFYIPLLLATRPPRLKRQLQKSRHLLWCVFFALLFSLWVLRCCEQPVFSWEAAVSPTASTEGDGFFRHLAVFPVKCLLYLMPWGLFFWTPFCLALQPLEPRGSVCSFFRAVVFCSALCAWLIPGTSPLSLLIILGPMAFLVSMNAPLVVRRNRFFFRRLSQWLGAGALAALALASLGCLAVACGFIRIGVLTPSSLRAMMFIHILIMMEAAYILLRSLSSRRSTIIAIACGWMGLLLAWRCMEVNASALALPDRSRAARQIIDSTGANAPLCSPETIYLTASRPYPVQCHYLGVPVIRIRKPAEDLPETPDEIYLLSNQHPLTKNRNWTPLSCEVDFTALSEWHIGDLNTFKPPLVLERLPLSGEAAAAHPRYLSSEKLRLYRGTLNSVSALPDTAL